MSDFRFDSTWRELDAAGQMAKNGVPMEKLPAELQHKASEPSIPSLPSDQGKYILVGDENGLAWKPADESLNPDVPVPEPELVSIRAVYTQGQMVVTTSTPLSALRAGLVVTATYSDSTTETVDDYTLFGALTVGTSTIAVSYGGRTATFNVVVTEITLTGISAVYTQGQTVITTSTPLNALTTGLVVTATYSDGNTQELSSAMYSLSGTLTVGTSTITVSYSGRTATFNVVVTEITLTGISAVYTQGQTVVTTNTPLNDLAAGLVVTATYSDNSTQVLSSAMYSLSGTLTVGTSTITVSYSGRTTTFSVVVTEITLTGISAVYTQGQTVVTVKTSLNDLVAGLVVTATYSDNSTQVLSSAMYSLSGTLAVGTSTITVSYSGRTATFNVTVTEITLTGISAVYTQGQTVVTPSTPLNDLAAGLVVTAMYSDNSTQVLPSAMYSLSGTLTVGTSTITVSYSGQSTTFSVTVTEITLTGISASYVQGDTVITPSTQLDTLKSALTVTASYSDGTTRILSASEYTLSGTLAAGTSTITASFSGQTATFAVAVTVPTTDVLVYHWVLTDSLVDKVQGVEAVPFTGKSSGNAPSQDGTGVHFTESQQALVLFTGSMAGLRFEFDVEEFDFQGDLSLNVNFLVHGQPGSGAYRHCPIVFYNGGWNSHGFSGATGTTRGTGGGWGDLNAASAINAFDGRTVKLEVDADGHTSRLYLDDELVGTIDTIYFDRDTHVVTLGGHTLSSNPSRGDQCYNMTITGVRVYRMGVPAEEMNVRSDGTINIPGGMLTPGENYSVAYVDPNEARIDGHLDIASIGA